MGQRARVAVATVVFGLSAILLAWVGWQWLSPPSAAPTAAPDEPLVSSSTPAASPRPGTISPSAPSPSVSAPPASPSAPAASATTTTTAAHVVPTEVLHLSMPSASYDSDVGTMEIADQGVINPPDFEHSWWIRDRGVIPSSSATDTSYLACHTHSRKPASVVPCNLITLDNVPLGSKITVTTDAETLVYTVTQARKVPRDQFATDPEIWDVNPGRLVWISCYLEDGRYSEFNIVVIAELSPTT